MYKIMIIEDDSGLSAAIKKQLEVWGYKSVCVKNFQKVTEEFIEYDPHLVLVDIMLPFFNGYHWCSEIRKISNVPVFSLWNGQRAVSFLTFSP